MGDMAEYGRAMKEHHRRRKARNLAAADPTGWKQHTPWHWSRRFGTVVLDYWPSRNKYQIGKGKVRTIDPTGMKRVVEQLTKEHGEDLDYAAGTTHTGRTTSRRPAMANPPRKQQQISRQEADQSVAASSPPWNEE